MRHRRPKPSIALGIAAAVVVASPVAVLLSGPGSATPTPAAVTKTQINEVDLKTVPSQVLDLVQSGLGALGVKLPPIDLSGLPTITLPPGLGLPKPADTPTSVPGTPSAPGAPSAPGSPAAPGAPSAVPPTSGRPVPKAVEPPDSTTPGSTTPGSRSAAPSSPSAPAPIPGLPAGAEVKEISRDDPFRMVALTWDKVAGTTTYVRARKADGKWGAWITAEPIDEKGKGGSEPIWVGDANVVQIVVTKDGLANPLLPSTPADPSTPSSAPSAPAAPSDPARRESTPSPTPAAFERPMTPGSLPPSPSAPAAPGPADPAPAAPSAPDAVRQMIEDMAAVLITPGTGPQDEALPAAPPVPGLPGKTPFARPAIISRAQWGADESLKPCQNPVDGPTKAMVVHHTGGSNDYTKEESAQVVRGIYAYHAQTLGWCDIGYHALVDKYGQIFEGAAGGLEGTVQGTHVGGFNADTTSLSLIGDLNQVAPTREMLDSAGDYLAWKLKQAGLDPNGTAQLTSIGFEGSPYAAGTVVSKPVILGHRDLGSTDCPGNLGYAALGELRTMAAKGGSGAAAAVPAAPVTSTPTVPGAPGEPAPGTATPVTPPLSPDDPGAIGERWRELGGPNGPLGNARTGEEPGPQDSRTVRFDNGTAVWSQETGARILWGAIGKVAESLGLGSSGLGLPTSDEYAVGDLIKMDFQFGQLVFDKLTGAVQTILGAYTRGPQSPAAPAAPAPAALPASPAPATR